MGNNFIIVAVLGIYLSAISPNGVYAQADAGPGGVDDTDTSKIPVGHEPKDDKSGTTRDSTGAGDPDPEPLDPTKESSASKMMGGKRGQHKKGRK